jgi:hypothetical protein
MASKLIHLNNSTAGKIPLVSELVPGQFAINTTDKNVYFLGSDNTIVKIIGNLKGTVTSVNSVSPDVNGAVALTPSNLGASTVGASVFTASSAGAARSALGSGLVGDTLFTSNTAASALSTLGGTTVGIGVFTATSAANAQTAIGATSVGSAVLSAASTTAAQTAIGGTTVGRTLFTAPDIPTAVAYLGVVSTSQINAANGVAPLDANGKIPVSNLPSSILGAVTYQGMFTPGTSTLPAAASGNQGWYFIAASAGTYTPPSNAQLTFAAGDWLISDGVTWNVVETQGAVTSVNGHTGAVTLVASDIQSGTFTAARLGASPGTSLVLTTDTGGNPLWSATINAAQIGATPGNNLVLTTSSTGTPSWVSTVPYANLPVASAAALGLAQAGTGLLVSGGIFSVNTAVLTMDEGSYTGS